MPEMESNIKFTTQMIGKSRLICGNSITKVDVYACKVLYSDTRQVDYMFVAVDSRDRDNRIVVDAILHHPTPDFDSIYNILRGFLAKYDIYESEKHNKEIIPSTYSFLTRISNDIWDMYMDFSDEAVKAIYNKAIR